MSLALLIVGLTLVTFVNRAGFILLIGRFDLPPLIRRSLRYVPAAAITALVVPALVMPAGTVDLSAGNLRLIAGLLACAIAWRTHSTVVTMLAGMTALFALQALAH